MANESHKIDSQGKRQSWLSGLATIGLMALGIAGVWQLWVVLARIRNDAESFDLDLPGLRRWTIAVVVGMGLAAVASLWSTFKPAERAGRSALIAGVVTFVFWYAPVPFSIQRYALIALLMVSATVFGLAALRASWRDGRGGKSGRSAMDQAIDQSGATSQADLRDEQASGSALDRWIGVVCAVGMTSAACLALLLAKIHEIGWAKAID